jgi:drug/metabolite transporter (DMT)-like permease
MAFVLVLLFASAFLHTGWNLILKQTNEKYIATWWALIISALVALPVLAFSKISIAAAWPYILASAVLEGIYYTVLVQAYRIGDFSLVYPLARGAAPALIAIWAVLFLGERLQVYGLIGLALVILGLLVVGSSAMFSRRMTTLNRASIVLALLVALVISLYSVVDGAAVKQFQPAPYLVLVFATTAILLSPVVIHHYGLPALATGWKMNWQRILLIGMMSMLAYTLVLMAYRVTPVSYAGAIREVSIILAALAGWRLLGENFGRLRVIGAAIVFVGILVIAINP